MTDTTEIDAAAPAADLSALRLPQLQAVASQLGITGTARMRKSELVAAIRGRQQGSAAPPPAAPSRASAPAGSAPAGSAPATRCRRR